MDPANQSIFNLDAIKLYYSVICRLKLGNAGWKFFGALYNGLKYIISISQGIVIKMLSLMLSEFDRIKGSSIKYVRKIFQKTNISIPLIRTRTCVYQGIRNASFSENFAYVLNGWPLINFYPSWIFQG